MGESEGGGGVMTHRGQENIENLIFPKMRFRRFFEVGNSILRTIRWD